MSSIQLDKQLTLCLFPFPPTRSICAESVFIDLWKSCNSNSFVFKLLCSSDSPVELVILSSQFESNLELFVNTGQIDNCSWKYEFVRIEIEENPHFICESHLDKFYGTMVRLGYSGNDFADLIDSLSDSFIFADDDSVESKELFLNRKYKLSMLTDHFNFVLCELIKLVNTGTCL